MPTNLTNTEIRNSFSQLLHVDGGPEAALKHVYSGTGVQTALRVGTDRIGVGEIVISGNFITTSAPGEDIVLLPSGDGALFLSNVVFTDVSEARAALLLGSLSTQNSNNVSITGGTISGVVFTGSFSGLTLVESATLATGAAAAGVNLSGNTLAADGTDTNIDINITPKGTGEVNITNVDILSGKVPFSTVTGRAFASFSDVTDQTGSTTVPTAMKFGTTEVAGSGITMVTDGTNLTRLTFAAAGTYMVAPNMQLRNADTADHDITVWLAVDGTNVPRSATRIVVPKAGDGGVGFFQIVFYVAVTAGQYAQIFWLPESTLVTLDHTAAVTGPPAIPAIPSTVLSVERVA
jgi:hypothetical protein